MYEAAASCKDIARTPVTNWEPHGVTLARCGYAVRHGMKIQLVTPYRVSHLQRYGVTIRGNVTSVDPPFEFTCLLLNPAIRSNAGMANRQGDVCPPVNTLALASRYRKRLKQTWA